MKPQIADPGSFKSRLPSLVDVDAAEGRAAGEYKLFPGVAALLQAAQLIDHGIHKGDASRAAALSLPEMGELMIEVNLLPSQSENFSLAHTRGNTDEYNAIQVRVMALSAFIEKATGLLIVENSFSPGRLLQSDEAEAGVVVNPTKLPAGIAQRRGKSRYIAVDRGITEGSSGGCRRTRELLPFFGNEFRREMNQGIVSEAGAPPSEMTPGVVGRLVMFQGAIIDVPIYEISECVLCLHSAERELT